MKKYVKEFVRRGLMIAGLGPVELAVIYGILGATGQVLSLTPDEVCRGILSITVMTFIAAGITSVYTVERLPVASAALLHAGVLYLDYLVMYLFNDWLPKNSAGIGVFTAVFVVGYALVWLVIYLTIRSKTNKINQNMQS